MSDTENIRQKLAELIQMSGHTYRELSLKIGRREAYIQQYIKYGLPKRLNEMDRRKLCLILNVDERELMDEELVRSTADYNEPDKITLEIYAPLPKKHLYNNAIGHLCLKPDEMRTWHKGDLHDLRIFRMSGDYLEPTINDGDMVVFDSAAQEFGSDGLYVIEIDKTAQIKRLQKADNHQIIVQNDNPLYASVRLAETKIKILGRPVYTFHARTL